MREPLLPRRWVLKDRENTGVLLFDLINFFLKLASVREKLTFIVSVGYNFQVESSE